MPLKWDIANCTEWIREYLSRVTEGTEDKTSFHAADPDSPHHQKAREFFDDLSSHGGEFIVCGLVLEPTASVKHNAQFISAAR